MRPRIAHLLIALVVASLAGIVGTSPADAGVLRPAPRSSVTSPMSGEIFVLSGSIGRSVRRVVALQYYSGGAWRTKQRKWIPAAGTYRFSVTQAATTTRWRVRAPKVRSRQARLTRTLRLTKVAQQATAAVADSTRLGRTVPVSTRFRPARPGRAVGLQHYSGGSWVTVAKATQSAAGTAAFSYTPSVVGRRSLRAVAYASRGAAQYAGAADLLATLPVKPIQVSAHRGNSVRYPENTLPAFDAAIRAGADWLEMDVRKTSNGFWVLMHDTNLKRTTNIESSVLLASRQNDPVKSFSREELKTLDAGSWMGKQFAGTKIPTLDEVLQLVKDSGRGVRLSVEVKPVGVEGEQGIVEVADLVEAFDADWINTGSEPDRVVFTSFSPTVAEHLDTYRGDGAFDLLDPEKKPIGAEVGAIFQPEKTPTDFSQFDWARQLCLSESVIGPALAKSVHDAGLDLVGWTADSTADILRLGVSGVDVVTTNDPVKARALLNP